MKLSIKLPLAFGIALLLMFSGAIYGIASLNHSIVEYNTTVQARVADERAVTKMLVTFKTQVQEWKDTLLRGEDPVKLDKYWAAFLKGEQAVSDQAKALQDSLPPGKSRDLIKQFAEAHVAMGVGYRKGHDMFVAASFDPTVGDKVVAGVDREPARLLDEAAQEIAKESIAVSAKTAEAAHTALVVSSALMLVAFGLGLAGAFIFSRTITKPLARAADVASAVSHGDLAKPFDSRGTDEIGQLLDALKQMQTNLANVVSSASECRRRCRCQLTDCCGQPESFVAYGRTGGVAGRDRREHWGADHNRPTQFGERRAGLLARGARFRHRSTRRQGHERSCADHARHL